MVRSVPELANALTITGFIDVPSAPTASAVHVIKKFDDARRRGLTLSLITGGGGASSPGPQQYVSFGVDDGSEPTWEDCGKPHDGSAFVSPSLTVIGDTLYAATVDSRTSEWGARLHRYTGGKIWHDLGAPPGIAARGIGPIAALGDRIFVATGTYDAASLRADSPPAQVFYLDSAEEWHSVGALGNTTVGSCRRIFALAAFAGRLYAAGDDDGLYVLGGDAWQLVRRFSAYPQVMEVFAGKLWVGTAERTSLASFDGENWYDVSLPAALSGDISQITALAAVDDALLVGSWPHGAVWRYCSGDWELLGAPQDSYAVDALASYNGALYAGSVPFAEVSRLPGPAAQSGDAARKWEEIIRFNVRQEWEPATIEKSGWQARTAGSATQHTPPALAGLNGFATGSDTGAAPAHIAELLGTADRGMRDWGRITALTEFAGKLFVATGNYTGTAADTGEYRVQGTVYALSTGMVLTSPAPLTPGRHHIAAVRDGLSIRLHIDGVCVAQRIGKRHKPLDLSGELPRSGPGLLQEKWWDRALSFDDISELASAHS